jgi:hypothetical protein
MNAQVIAEESAAMMIRSRSENTGGEPKRSMWMWKRTRRGRDGLSGMRERAGRGNIADWEKLKAEKRYDL